MFVGHSELRKQNNFFSYQTHYHLSLVALNDKQLERHVIHKKLNLTMPRVVKLWVG